MTIMKLVALAALVATAASETVSVFPATGVGGAKPCVAKTFSGHTCPTSCSGMQDISSAAITTAEQCVAACCADPKVPICTYAGFNAKANNRCIAGDWHKCSSCRRGSDTTFLVNFAPPSPPSPSPPSPSPPSPSPPPPKALTLPKVLDSLMVLQRAPKAAVVWGWAPPGAQVTVSLDGKVVATATSSGGGSWKAPLPPQAASINHTLTFATTSTTKTLTGVAFGDVFQCSGQSHMTFSVNQDMNGKTTIAESASYPGIRMLTVNTDVSTTPLDDIRGVKYAGPSTWLQSAPPSFGHQDFSYPSAICYYFARELYAHFNATVPIGIISASVGGSAIEFWQSDAARADKTCGGGINITSACPPNTLPAAAATLGAPSPPAPQADVRASAGGWTPSCFYNAMVHPLGNFALKGILWDQGEANNGDDCSVWGCKLAALAYDYRTVLYKQPDLLFTFDQFRADPFAGGIGVPGYAKLIPNAAFSSRVDLQTCLASDTSEGHAVRKLEVGRRLGMAARVAGYGEAPTTGSFGPSITGVTAAPSAGNTGLMEVSVSLANAGGLHHADMPDCDGCCAGEGGPLIAGSPKTGDSWVFGLSGGGTVAVCQKTTHASCTGNVSISLGKAGADTGTVSMLVAIPHGKSIEYIIYGGTGPWLSSPLKNARGNATAPPPPPSLPTPPPAPPPLECMKCCEEPKPDGACCCLVPGCPIVPLPPSCPPPPTAPAPPPPVPKCVYPHQPRFGLEACGLYNGGPGGYDAHAGVAMAAQFFRAV